jgi:hypothetical protein
MNILKQNVNDLMMVWLFFKQEIKSKLKLLGSSRKIISSSKSGNDNRSTSNRLVK